MILNLFALIAILCTISPVMAEAEPHSGAHPGNKLRVAVAEAEPHSGAHPGKAKVHAAEAKVKLTAHDAAAVAKKVKAQLKVSAVPASVEQKTVAAKREFVRGQSVRLESVQPPQPTHVAGNRLLVQYRVYDAPDCAENSLYQAGGFAANVCIPEENELPSGRNTITTAYTALRVNTPQGAFMNVVQNYFGDRYCTDMNPGDAEVWDSELLDVCQPLPAGMGFDGKFIKHIARKDVLMPTSTVNKGVLMHYYGGKRGCHERDMLGLTDFYLFPDACVPVDMGSVKFHCDENGPKYSFFLDDACTQVQTADFDISNLCDDSYLRADCIAQPPNPPL